MNKPVSIVHFQVQGSSVQEKAGNFTLFFVETLYKAKRTFPIPGLFLYSTETGHGGRGHWTVYYNSQTKQTFSYSLETLVTSIEFVLVGSLS